jgi:hypothetical protein
MTVRALLDTGRALAARKTSRLQSQRSMIRKHAFQTPCPASLFPLSSFISRTGILSSSRNGRTRSVPLCSLTVLNRHHRRPHHGTEAAVRWPTRQRRSRLHAPLPITVQLSHRRSRHTHDCVGRPSASTLALPLRRTKSHRRSPERNGRTSLHHKVYQASTYY